MALTNKLSAIGNAIREKTGTTELLTLDEMPIAISSITTGDGESGGTLPEEGLVITGNCTQRFGYDGWNWFIENYGDKITTKDITSVTYMFAYSGELETIPFDLNFQTTNGISCNSVFDGCYSLKKIGKFINLSPSTIQNVFTSCRMLRELPEFVDCDFTRIHNGNATTYSGANMYQNCYSLRQIPEELLKQIYNSKLASQYYGLFRSGFQSCYVLDEIRGLMPITGNFTSNTFLNTFDSCYRVNNVIFAMQEDGIPYNANWKTQTIDLSTQVGYAQSCNSIIDYNSGITADKEVKDNATYQALKNNPDWFTLNVVYSRYNHDSAVATINSLPDTSAYLAEQGGTNTIKFNGAAGSATDGGAINTLTEEEIAVATAKGWTVSLV